MQYHHKQRLQYKLLFVLFFLGGLIALASTSIALGRDTEQYIYEIVNPM